MSTEAKPSPPTTPGLASQHREKGIRIFMWPKVIFLYPTAIVSLICAAGMSIIHDEDAVKRVPRSLRTGRAVAFLVDQGAVGLASTWVPFFGRLAKTPRGPAVFALRLGAPIVFGVAVRRPSGRYVLTFEAIDPVETGDREADVDHIVADYTLALERHVRRAPEQYFWHHRRWKHQRPGTPPELGDPL